MNEYTEIGLENEGCRMFVSNICKGDKVETRTILLIKDKIFYKANVSAGGLLKSLREIENFSGITDLCWDGSVKIEGGLKKHKFVSLYFFFDNKTFECVVASYDDLIDLG